MLIDYYPRVVGQIREMKEICKAEQPEFDNINKEVDRLLANMFITTSDEHGIARFEEELGIVPTPEQSIEERRIVVLIRVAKKNLSFKDILNLIQNYSSEIDLAPDYDNDELSVIVGDAVNNVGTIYKTLDGILGLNIYIYFAYEATAFLEMIETPKALDLETTVNWWGNRKDAWYLDGSVKLDGSRLLNAAIWRQNIALELETKAKTAEQFKLEAIENEITTFLEMKETKGETELETTVNWWLSNPKIWCLNGSVKLDGSKKLDAVLWEQTAAVELETSVKTTETFEDITVTMRRDLWYLDGSAKLDGSKKLDAKEIKEEI
ncbi:DUF2313 domain-containing protein [bacterium D16-51]|nr:DUF2313 domain-containing protein [bacterium D16-59]RKI56263.1 DUF2313 domain-containing protein [bacterium D16-51]